MAVNIRQWMNTMFDEPSIPDVAFPERICIWFGEDHWMAQPLKATSRTYCLLTDSPPHVAFSNNCHTYARFKRVVHVPLQVQRSLQYLPMVKRAVTSPVLGF